MVLSRIACVLVIISAVGGSSVFAGKVYTWKDKDGNVHITDTPAPKDAAGAEVITHRPRPKDEQPPSPSSSMNDLASPHQGGTAGETPILRVVHSVLGESEQLDALVRGLTIRRVVLSAFFTVLGIAYVIIGVKRSRRTMVLCGIALMLYHFHFSEAPYLSSIGAALGLLPLGTGVLFRSGSR